MKKYNCLKAIPLSFYSADLYRDVARNWGASVLFYLGMLIAFCSVFWTISAQWSVNKSFNAELGTTIDQFMSQVPLITLKANGTIETPENKPYFILDNDKKKVVAIIDTSGQYKTLENQPFDFLITKTQYMVRKNKHEIQIKEFPKEIDYVFHPETAKATAQYWAQWLWVFFFPVFILGPIIWRLIQGSIYAVFGKLIGVMVGIKLPYYTVFSLTLVSLTPSIILRVILDLGDIHFSGQGIVIFILQMIYLTYAIKACGQDLSNKIEA